MWKEQKKVKREEVFPYFVSFHSHPIPAGSTSGRRRHTLGGTTGPQKAGKARGPWGATPSQRGNSLIIKTTVTMAMD